MASKNIGSMINGMLLKLNRFEWFIETFFVNKSWRNGREAIPTV
jgi:hypothetical protein